MHSANGACGVRNAAARKYVTRRRLWHLPPPGAFSLPAEYANERGDPGGRPYYSLDGTTRPPDRNGAS